MTARSDSQYQNIACQIRAILFLGTPHRDSAFGQTLGRILETFPGAVSDAVRELIMMESINDQCLTDCVDLQLVSFYETRKTQITGAFNNLVRDLSCFWHTVAALCDPVI